VKSHRILGIVVGRNGKLLRRHLIWIQIYKRQLNPKQRRRTYIMYVQSILDYQLLAIWPSLNKEQRQQLTRTGYKGARFILQAPATVDGSICCREAHIFPPAERYEILLMKRYYRIRRYEEDELTIPALLHALSQLDPQWKLFILPIRATPWSTIKYKKESKLYAEDSGKTTQSSSLNAQNVCETPQADFPRGCFRSLHSGQEQNPSRQWSGGESTTNL